MYEVRYKKSVSKDLKKIGKSESKRILKAIKTRLAKDPRSEGIPLRGKLGVIWRYRIGNYRVLYSFNDNELWVLVVHIAHRRDVYNKKKAFEP